MKKSVLLLSLILLVVAALAFLRHRSQQEVVEEAGRNAQASGERARIQKFWEIYRQATRNRVAGRVQEAAVGYRKALALNERHEDSLYYLGNMYLELGRLPEAKDAWERLVALNPNSGRAHLQLGNLHLYYGGRQFFDIDVAEREFHRALEIYREQTIPLLRIGEIALIRGNLRKAGDDFEAVAASNPDSYEAHFLLGYVLWKGGDRREALERFRNAVSAAQPEEPVEGVLGEGDTKAGESYHRAVYPLLFQEVLGDLAEVPTANLADEMNKRYRRMDVLLNEIRNDFRPQR